MAKVEEQLGSQRAAPGRAGCTASATSGATTTGWRRSSSPSSTTTAWPRARMDRADVILLAPSRCGKTPTAMYLALQHGLFVANYPLVDEDLEQRPTCPVPVRDHRERCFGLTTTVDPAQPGAQGAPARSRRYACEEQCRFELRRADRDVRRARHPRRGHLGPPRSRRSSTVDHADPGRRRSAKAAAATTLAGRPRGRSNDPNDTRTPTACGGSPTSAWTTSTGRRQERLAGRDDLQPGRRRGQRARRVRHHRRGLPALPGRRRPGGRDRRAQLRRAWTPTTSARWPPPGAAIRGSVVEQDFPDGARGRDPRAPTSSWSATSRRRRAVLRRPLLARPPRTCPTPPSPGSRRPSSTCAASTRCCRRSGRSTPPSTTTARSPTACTTASSTPTSALSAGVQRMVRSDLGASGVMFTMDTESGFDDAVFITSAYGLGEGVVQGAVNPDEFYVYKPALRAGRPAVLKRGIGEQGHQDGLHRRRRRGPHHRVRRRRPGRGRGGFSLTDDEVTELARHALTDRGALRPPDGHRVGQGRPRRASSTSSRPARRRCSRAQSGCRAVQRVHG